MNRLCHFRLFGLATATILMLASTPGVTAGIYDTWPKKMKVTFAGYNKPETLTNFPALIVFSNAMFSGFSYGDFQSLTNQDLRFANSNETTALNYEIDTWNTNGTSYVWVQVPTLSSTNDCIYAYWGKSGANAPPCTTNGATWTNGYLGVWHMNQANALDSTSSGFTCAAHGNTNAAGQIAGGQALSSSASSYLGVPNMGFSGNVSISVSAWIKAKAGLANGTIFGFGLGDSYKSCSLRTDGDGQFFFYFWGEDCHATGAGNYYGAWTHVAATYAAASKVQTIYKTGTSIASRTAGTPLNAQNQGYGIGRYNNAENFDGLMDEVRVSSVTRSANWVWAEWMNMASNGTFSGSFNNYEAVQQALGTGAPNVDNANGATNVTLTSAWMNGTLTSTGTADTAVSVYWGTTDGGTNGGPTYWANTTTWAAPQSLGGFTTNVTGLSSNATYYYRFAASNEAGVVWSASSVPFVTGEIWVEKTADAAEQGFVPGTFTVHRPSSVTNAAITVNYVVGGSGGAGVDYVNNLGNSVTFDPGASTATVVVTPLLNSASNSDSTVTLTILPGAYVVGTPSNATMTIANWALARPATFYVNVSGGDDTRAMQIAIAPATPWKTITHALSQAASGDTINVAAGTYGTGTETFPLNMKNGVTLQGAGFTNTTITFGGGQGNLVVATSLTTGKIDGFTFTGIGDGDACTGVVILNNSTLTFSNNRIRGNYGRGNGWGIQCWGGSSLIENNLIQDNWSGGGVQVGGGSPTIQNCTFIGNVPAFSRSGGTPLVRDCIFWGNSSDVSGLSASMVSNCCIKSGDFKGTNGCFATDPLLTGGYFLSQTTAGQSADSPCLNAGSQSAAAAGMDTYTTRTDGQNDSGQVDVGYHFIGGTTTGRTVYVAKTGNDTTGTGSSGSPWLTITKAMNQATYGTVINVAAGTYQEGVNIFMVDGVTLQGTGWTNCIIDRNGGQTHVIECIFINSGKIDGFTLTGVRETDGSSGLLLYASSLRVSNCRIFYNQARNGGAGIEIDLPCSRPELRNLLVDHNYYSSSGPAIQISGAYPTLINCTIVSNQAPGLGNGGLPIIQNCIFWGNNGDAYGLSASMINNCDISDGQFNTTNGCVSADPLFAGASTNNFRLSAGSPCIGAGTNQSWMATATDLDGNPRLSGMFPSTRVVDMGAYEYQYPVRRGMAVMFR